MDNYMMKWKKERVLANLYLMKNHFLIIKLFIVKGISSWIMKVLKYYYPVPIELLSFSKRLTIHFNSNKF